MARTYHETKNMEDISLFSTSQTLEELELFSSFPIFGESGTLEQCDVYIEETDSLKHQLDASSPLSLSATDLLEEFDVEGQYFFLGTEQIDDCRLPLGRN